MTQDLTPWQVPQDRILIYCGDGFGKSGKSKRIDTKMTIADHGGGRESEGSESGPFKRNLLYKTKTKSIC